LSLALTLVMTAVVARLLTPQELGLFALTSGVVLVTEVLRDFGTGAYIVQEREPSRTGVRTAFTVMLGFGAALALALTAGSEAIATFYGEPRLAAGLRMAALGLVLSAFAAPLMSILRRELDFLPIALINISSGVIAASVTITLILLGYGYLSMIVGGLVASVYIAAAAQLYRPTLWLYVPCLDKGREIATFGGLVSATAVLNNVYVMLPNFVLPRIAGFEAAALFSRATQLSQLSERVIVGAIAPVILPAFAALARSGADLRRSYLYGVSLVTAVQWPALLGLAILAEPAVRFVLGDQWDAAAGLLRILALAGLFMAPAALTFPILVAAGHTRDTLSASLISLTAGAAVFAVAAPFGLHLLAMSFLVSLPLQMLVALAFIRRRLGFTWRELARACARSAVCALTASAPPLLLALHTGFAFSVPPLHVLLALTGGAAAWLAGLALTRHPLLLELRRGVSAFRPVPVPA
jgi:O-antigen/teichoic acid export membrane protein